MASEFDAALTGQNQRTSHRLRFRLRTLLVAIMLLCWWLGWKAKEAREQHAAVEAIRAVHGTVHYSFEFDSRGNVLDSARPFAPQWLRNLVGEDFFLTVVSVEILTSPVPGGYHTVNLEVTDETLRQLSKLPYLERLGIRATQLTDAGLETIASLKKLRDLTVFSPLVTDAGIAKLAKLNGLKRFGLAGERLSDASIEAVTPLTNLESLELRGGQMTDAGLEHLRAFPSLSRLDLSSGTKMTGAALRHVGELPQLRILWVSGINIEDQDLAPLECLQNLESVDFLMTSVSAPAMVKLQQALPNARLSASGGGGFTYYSGSNPASAATTPTPIVGGK